MYDKCLNNFFLSHFLQLRTLSGVWHAESDHFLYHIPESEHFPGYDTWKVTSKQSTQLFCHSLVALSLAHHCPRRIPPESAESEHSPCTISQKVSPFHDMICDKWIKICEYLCKIVAQILNCFMGVKLGGRAINSWKTRVKKSHTTAPLSQ